MIVGLDHIGVVAGSIDEAMTTLQRFGPGLHHWGYACDDVAAEAARLRARGLRQIDLGGRPDGDSVNVAFFHPKSAGGILTELVPVRARRSPA